jgi:hypothetical protein
MTELEPRRRPSGAIRWMAIAFLLVAGLAAWLSARPDPKAGERERSCKAWGITDQAVLSKCRVSVDEEHAAIEPFKRAAAEREIDWFNRDLQALRSGKTRADEGSYPSLSIDGAYEAAGGMLGFIIGPLDGTTFPAKGRHAKIVGVIITNEPDQNERPSEPRYFTLETEILPSGVTAAHQGADKVTMSTTINLDIDSLTRYERQFIVDHCHHLWATPCRATIFGHFDEIVGRRSELVRYVGIVADQVDIEPLNWSTARPDWFLSARSLMAR